GLFVGTATVFAACSGVDNCLSDLESGDASVRASAVFKLGSLGARPAVPALSKIVNQDPDDSLRRSAIQALGAIGDPAGVKALKPLLTDAVFRRDVIKALVAIKDEAAVDALIEGLEDQETQLAAAQGLGELADPSAKSALTRLMRETDDERVFGVASMAVQRINSFWGPTEQEMGIPLYPKADYIPNPNGDWVFMSKDPVDQIAAFYQKSLGRSAMNFSAFVSKYESEFNETEEGGLRAEPELVFVAREQEFGGQKYPSTLIFLQKVRKETEIKIYDAKGGGEE
ncbi:MAG TPA: HEAT repeat domain-containing protein, partial [Nitrospiria bacterium]|nr:HEAT repeat domain-containing protein [Nitrospiria bacterium]